MFAPSLLRVVRAAEGQKTIGAVPVQDIVLATDAGLCRIVPTAAACHLRVEENGGSFGVIATSFGHEQALKSCSMP